MQPNADETPTQSTNTPPAPVSPDAFDAGPGDADFPARDWSMLLIMMAIIAALGFGGTAMMYRRAELSKLQAEAAAQQARLAREDAERARKEAQAQQRLVTELQARLQGQLLRADTPETSATPPRETASTPGQPSVQARASTTPALTPVSDRREPSPSPLLDAVEPTMPVAPPDMRAVLDSAARDLEAGKLSGKPAADAAVHSTLGRTYLSLGDRARAVHHLEQAVALRASVAGDNDPEVIKDRRALDRARQDLR